nr:hypothetical protein [Gammaproteobacteria bacterium]
MWELIDPDPDRFALIDGKTISIMTEPRGNLARLRQPIAEDFLATVKVQMRVERDHAAYLSYVWDEKYSLSVGVDSGKCCSSWLYLQQVVKGRGQQD